jgi:hypothetical protein
MSPLIGTALELTEQVQAAIDAGEWLRAQELEAQRLRVLRELASADDASGAVTATFRALEERNHRLIGLVQHHRRRVLREAALARSSEAGVAAYGANSAQEPPQSLEMG